MHSLRSQLVIFWLILLAFCATLSGVMVSMYSSSAGAQIAAGKAVAEQSCNTIAQRYARSMEAGAPASPQVGLLQVLLQLVLISAPHVEGGVWQKDAGFIAYAYPTYEGSGVKNDVPAAEQPLIAEISQRAASSAQLQTDVVRGSREALIVSACPLISTAGDLSAWTMTRTHAGALAAQSSLRIGLAALLLVVVVSGIWLGTLLLRGFQHVQRLEAQLAAANGEGMPGLARTGVRELDRIVDGFNHYRLRFEEARLQLAEAAQQRNRDQRLAALGRMTGGVAHEIRNPIAAMRLKAENALAAAPDRQPDALRAIIGQIDRLDSLVRSLLALVQPISLALEPTALGPWLQERMQAATPRAADRGVQIELQQQGQTHAVMDPVHLARAVDNLLDNAVRHAALNGRVVLRVSADDKRSLRLTVEDDGAGVAPHLQAHLFEPFATGRADGTGLGLAMAREVAYAHGGDLRHSALQPGTRFELEIPWRNS